MGDVPGVWGEIGADSTPLKRGVKDATKELKKLKGSFSKSLREFGRGIKQLGATVTAAGKTLAVGAAAMLVPLAKAISLAGSYQESLSKFRAVFKEFSADSLKWSKEFAKRMGMSRADIIRFMAALQDTFVPLGFARKRATELSKSLVKLAVDVASFQEAAEEDVMRAFQSALVGNHEAVRAYGISITEASLKQELLNMGIEKGTTNATAQEKILARLAIITRASADAIGDKERTLKSYSNQVKRLKGSIKDLGIAVGEVLVPELAKSIEKLADQIELWTEWIKKNPEIVKGYFSLAKTITKVAAALIALGAVVTVGTWIAGLVKGIGLAAGLIKGLIALLGAKGLLLYLGPAGLIALAVIALVAIIVKYWDKIKAVFDPAAWAALGRAAATALKDAFVSVFRFIGDRIARLRDRVAEALGLSKKFISRAGSALGSAALTAAGAGAFVPAFQSLTPAVQTAGDTGRTAASRGAVTDNRQVVINVQGPIDEASLAARVKDSFRRDSYREQGI